MKRRPIDGAGRWLRDDAAASYLRMIADGMPKGGIAAAGRTYAEQARLYKLYKAGKGNLAARPGTSKHESGLALDITRRTPAQLWATQGGDPMARKAGEQIRANDYGWLRTVPSEAWHFSYDPKRDKHLNDEVHHADPATPPPSPKPTPKSAQVTVMVANCQSYDGDRSEAAWRARAALMAKSSPDVILVQETSEPGRNVMRLALGAGWRYYSNGKSVALFVGPRVKTAGLKRTVSFGTAFGHGAVKLPLKVDGIGFDATSQHTRPGSVASNAQKDADIAKGAKLTGKWPGIFGGDFARDKPNLPGWQRVTPVTDSMDKAGMQTPDAIFTKGKITVLGAKVIDPGKLSDHRWLLATLSVTG